MSKLIEQGLNEAIDKGEVKDVIDRFNKENIHDTRFILLIGIHNDGSCYYRSGGSITGLELAGIINVTQGIVDEVEENLE